MKILPGLSHYVGSFILVTSFQLVTRALPQVVSGANPRSAIMRSKLLASAIWHDRQLTTLAQTNSPALRRILTERPAAVVGTLIWPYICASWRASKRLNQLAQHYTIVDSLGPRFQLSVHEQLDLLCLSDIHPGLRVVLDQPEWFIREGGFTINLFIDDYRAYSLAFSFSYGRDGIECLIGSLQGRSTESAKNNYRDLTKAAHGLRPRDLLIEVCRLLCRHWGVRRLLAIRNDQRHQRHSYFGSRTPGSQNYDAVWEDRGGVLNDDFFYQLPLELENRRSEDIKPNKRSLYRRRYSFLERIEVELNERLYLSQAQMAAE